MIDRQARDRMADAIRAYMDEKTGAFQFRDTLTHIASATEDDTVHDIDLMLWGYADEYKDHKIVASKEGWDHLSRLLLILDSDGNIETVRVRRRWHITQTLAAVCMAVFVYALIPTGFGSHLFGITWQLGIASMALTWMNRRRERRLTRPIDVTLMPFESVSNLLSVRRRITGFVKTRYPKDTVMGRSIRSGLLSAICFGLLCVYWGVMWLLFSPAVLLIQMFPERVRETRVTTARADETGHAIC